MFAVKARENQMTRCGFSKTLLKLSLGQVESEPESGDGKDGISASM